MQLFFNQFWRNRKTIGSVHPSSRFLVDKMLRHVDFEGARTLVELGPGTGAFTFAMLERMHADARLLVLELHTPFYQDLKPLVQDDPRVILCNASATDLPALLHRHNLPRADVIVSSLPLANFDAPLRRAVLDASHNSLAEHGQYLQYQYSLQALRLLNRRFGEVAVQFVPLNFPPAFCYRCRGA